MDELKAKRDQKCRSALHSNEFVWPEEFSGVFEWIWYSFMPNHHGVSRALKLRTIHKKSIETEYLFWLKYGILKRSTIRGVFFIIKISF